MIIVKLIGGLGNQMFQYAAGRRAAWLNQTSLKLDISGYKHQIGITPRKYMLGVFNIEENFSNFQEVQRLKKKFYFLRKSYIKEKQFHFDANILKIKDNSYLEGNWQSEEYFKDIEFLIRKDFVFKEKVDKKNLSLVKKILNCNSISIHIRRGDYTSDKQINAFHGVCELEYYKRAIKFIATKIQDPYFFVFSDDIFWVKKNLPIAYPTYFMDNNVGGKDYDDMRMMSLCAHNIIANSSFSWWAAWLNQNPRKIVISPSKWFKKTSINTNNLILQEWIKI